jgi:hypothetical protein
MTSTHNIEHGGEKERTSTHGDQRIDNEEHKKKRAKRGGGFFFNLLYG